MRKILLILMVPVLLLATSCAGGLDHGYVTSRYTREAYESHYTYCGAYSPGYYTGTGTTRTYISGSCIYWAQGTTYHPEQYRLKLQDCSETEHTYNTITVYEDCEHGDVSIDHDEWLTYEIGDYYPRDERPER